MLHTELSLLTAIVAVFAAGWAFSLYLHDMYWMYRQESMGPIPKTIFIIIALIIAALYVSIVYQVFRDKSDDKATIVSRFIILFICNIIFFGLIYFILYLFNNQEYGKADENVVIASSLQGRYIQMIYLSMVTFFTVGYSNVVPFGIASRVVSIVQIMTAYIISAYLYSRSSILFDIK